MRSSVAICIAVLLAGCQCPLAKSADSKTTFVSAVLSQDRFYFGNSNGKHRIFNEVNASTDLFPILFGSVEEGVASYVAEAEAKDVRLAEAVMDYFSQNEEDSTLDSVSLVGVPFESFAESEGASIRDRPAAMLYLSKPGFSRDGSVGVMYVSQSSGRCSSGGLEVMRFRNGTWQAAPDWAVGGRTR